MGASNLTPTLELPQFEDNDRPTWRGDVNDAFSKIDVAHTAVKARVTALENTDATTYSESEVDALLLLKANQATTYTKTETDNGLSAGLAGKVGKNSLVFNVKDFGALGDDVADDTAEIQAAFDACPESGIVYFPPGTYKISAAISITKVVLVLGGTQYHTFIKAYACGGFTTANGLGDVRFRNISIQAAVQHTTTPNTYIGILVNGTNAARPGYHVYEDVWIRGFETAIQTNYLWTSAFRNVHTVNGLIGIDVYGLSENNNIIGGNLVVGIGSQTRLNGSASIRLNGQISRTDATALVSEGWMISNVLMYGGDYGVLALGYGNYTINHCIFDAIQISAFKVANNGTAYGSHALIDGCVIALASNAVTTEAAIEINNTVAGTRGSRVQNCDILARPGANAPYGVRTNASASAQVVVSGCMFSGFNAADVSLASSGNIVTDNRCLSALVNPQYNIMSASGQLNLVSDNIGTVLIATPNFPNTYAMAAGGVKNCRGTGIPTALSWAVGDRVVNSAPAVGSPKAWTCTVAGSPGTWVSEGNL